MEPTDEEKRALLLLLGWRYIERHHVWEGRPPLRWWYTLDDAWRWVETDKQTKETER